MREPRHSAVPSIPQPPLDGAAGVAGVSPSPDSPEGGKTLPASIVGQESAFDPEAEMVEGYRDGFDRDYPEPGPNRSASYRHGFANARDDVNHKPRASAQMLRVLAKKALREDRQEE